MADVILDSDQIPEGISKQFRRFPGEELADFHLRVTHLHHQNQRIRHIGDLSAVKNLAVLYLYDNRIDKIERLESVAAKLQLLYLQRNRIRKLENVAHLTKLRKLYLSGNCIAVVEGLELMGNLRELHVDHQRLAEGENLVIDPRTCRGLKRLLVLNVSGNKMLSLKPIDHLKALTHLQAADNALEDLEDAKSVLQKMPALKCADLRGNPICRSLRSWEQLVGAAQHLETLNEKRIGENSRIMIRKMHKFKPS